ncbi:photosynthetic complex assembly protein PuhC [Rhodoferax antarcticus]|uniref:photosynthetic complex assembly protein PuhC n=1 Tax=Rhodoferax antarcticus TaxID=81479 RepID=UPI0022249100|nr:photosynthetic complex assembly protein PuhC [Rhodoferax antarcticus]MCW2310424.1 putative photosynthetic complex assembly protein [Rhodoferax antarcticus]
MIEAKAPKIKRPPINKPISVLIGFLILVLALVAFARFQGLGWTVPDAPVLWERALVFVDTPEGNISARDFSDSKEIAVFKGEQGFLRGTLRALARERRVRGIGSEAPFVVLARTDGRLTLTDPSTSQRIDLESFGPTNSAIFRQFKKQ